jgi:hypothetical protein
VQPAARKAPYEYLLALVIAISPVAGSFVVKPDTTRWIVFGIGAAMVLAVLVAAARPVPIDRDS